AWVIATIDYLPRRPKFLLRDLDARHTCNHQCSDCDARGYTAWNGSRSKWRHQEISPGTTSVASALDFAGDYLLPGLIDIHTDNLERHLLPRTNADWPVM